MLYALLVHGPELPRPFAELDHASTAGTLAARSESSRRYRLREKERL